MEWWEQIEKRERELAEAVGRFVMEWARLEQAIPVVNQWFVRQNQSYNYLYGTPLQDLPPPSALNEEAKFMADLKNFKKLTKTAAPEKATQANSIFKRAIRIYSSRNDIVHRAGTINQSWWGERRAMVEYKHKREKKLEGEDRYRVWCYFTADVFKLTDETKALQFEIREFPHFQVEHILRENNLTRGQMTELLKSRR